MSYNNLVNLYYNGGINMVDFGNTLKELRKNAGLTQQELADRIWVSKAAVSYYEQSLRCPSPEILVKISQALHVSTDYLLGLEDKKQVIDVSGLNDEDIRLVENTIDLLRSKNNRIRSKKEREY